MLGLAPSLSYITLRVESASQEEVEDVADEWLLRLMRGGPLLANVFTTIQEARAEMMAASNADALASGAVQKWFDRTVSVANGEHSGGEPFPPTGGSGDAALDGEGWVSMGQPPIMCKREVWSPGWQEREEYPPSCEMTFELNFYGAKYMSIVFEEDTELEQGADYITFFRDATCTSFYGERRYTGPRQSIWPGIAGVPPLVISSDHCFVHFHSDASHGMKGFKFTASAPVSGDKAEELLEVLASSSRAQPGDELALSRDDDLDDPGFGGRTEADKYDADLLACQLALRDTNNMLDRARAYLFSNQEGLLDEAKQTIASRRDKGISGVFKNKRTNLQVNLQTGELVVGDKALLPVPADVTGNKSYYRAMGVRQVPLCSVVASDDDGEWLSISADQRAQLDAAEVDIFVHRVKQVEPPQSFAAKHEQAALARRAARTYGKDGEHGAVAAWLALRAAIRRAVDEGVAELDPREVDMHDFTERCMAAFETLGISSLEGVKFLKEADGAHLAAKLEELQKPVHRRQFVTRLKQMLAERLAAQLDADDELRGVQAEDTGLSEGAERNKWVDGPWLLGGYDERHEPPAPTFVDRFALPTLRQEEGGLRWCGCLYEPYHPLNAPPEGPVPLWQQHFETKLFATLKQGEFAHVRESLLLWKATDLEAAACPILMYCPPLGDPVKTAGHMGQLWEIGSLHEGVSPTAAQPEEEAQQSSSRSASCSTWRSSRSATPPPRRREDEAAEARLPDLARLPPSDSSSCGASAHERLELQDDERFGVWAVLPNGLHAYERRLSYSNDLKDAIHNHSQNDHQYTGYDFSMDGRNVLWLPRFRNESPLLFSGLFDREGYLMDNRNGIGAWSHIKIDEVSLKRTRPPMQRAADAKALEDAGLSDIDREEWIYQLHIPVQNLHHLLPEPLTTCFAFWQTSPTTIWAYRSMDWVNMRAEEEKEAKRKSKSVYREEWFDGYAFHITLNSTIGLEWREISHGKRPATGTEVISRALSAALLHKTIFTESELARFGLRELHRDSFVKAGEPGHERFFQPSDRQWQKALVRRLNWVSPLGKEEGEEICHRRGPTCLTLLNPHCCAPGSTVRKLLKVLSRLQEASCILFWTDSAVTTAGEACTVHSIELPRLELTFTPKEVWLPGESSPVTRYCCESLSGMWLAEAPNQPHLQKHLDGLPIGVWLENAEHEYALLLPHAYIRRLHRFRCPMIDDSEVPTNSPDLGSYEVRKHGKRVFLYPLHSSGSHLRTTSIADALFLALCRLQTRRYAMVPPLIDAAFKDTPYEKFVERPILSNILSYGQKDSMCEAKAVILPLMLTCLEARDPNVDKAAVKRLFTKYLTSIKNISPECLLSPDTELRLCIWCGEAGRAKIIKAQMELSKPLDGVQRSHLKLHVPPPKTRKTRFMFRRRDEERLQPQSGLVFWDEWTKESYKIVDKGALWFDSTVPPAPGALTVVACPPALQEHAIQLQWKPPPSNTHAPVEGYIIEMRDMSAKDSAWHDVLAKVSGDEKGGKAKACCTWSTETEWQLGSDVLVRGKEYTFRIRAVNRLGASEPSAEVEPAVSLPLEVKAATPPNGLKGGTTKAKGRSSVQPTLSQQFWHFSMLFSQTNADELETVKKFCMLCSEYGLFAHGNKLGFCYLYGLLTGQFQPWTNLTKPLSGTDSAPLAAKGTTLGVVAIFGMPAKVTEAEVEATLQGTRDAKDGVAQRPLAAVKLVDAALGVWYGRFERPLDAESAVAKQPQLALWREAGSPHPQPQLVHGNKLVQLKMEHSWQDDDDEEVPHPQWFSEPLMEEFEHPRWEGPIPRSNITAVKLIIQGQMLMLTSEGRVQQPHFFGGLMALLTGLVSAQQQLTGLTKQTMLQSLPVFPVARNRQTLAYTSMGLRTNRGQGFTFLKQAFLRCRQFMSLIPTVTLIGGPLKDASIIANEWLTAQEGVQPWTVDLNGHRSDSSIDAVVHRDHLRSLRPTISDSNQNKLLMPLACVTGHGHALTVPARWPSNPSESTASLLVFPEHRGAVDDSASSLVKLINRPLEMLWVETERVDKQPVTKLEGRFELRKFGHMEKVKVAADFLERMRSDLSGAKEGAMRGTALTFLKGFDKSKQLSVALAVHSLRHSTKPLEVTLGRAYSDARTQGELALMIKAVEDGFPNSRSTVDELPLAESTTPLLVEASAIFEAKYKQLTQLCMQLRELVASETAEVQRHIAIIQDSAAPRLEDTTTESHRLQQQIRQASHHAMRPSFELLVYGQLSTRQAQDLGEIDSQLQEMAHQMRTHIALCQLRTTRLRYLGFVSANAQSALDEHMKLATGVLSALSAKSTAMPASMQPSVEMLRATLRRTRCNFQAALDELEKGINTLLGEDKGIHALLLSMGMPSHDALRAAYIIADLVDFELTSVQPSTRSGVLALAREAGETQELSVAELLQAVRCAERGQWWRGRRIKLPPKTWLPPTQGMVSASLAASSADLEPLSVIAVSLYGDQCSGLAKLICYERTLFAAEAEGSAKGVVFDPRVLAFEFAGRFMLRAPQSVLVHKLNASASKGPTGESCCQQMIMGGGKSAFIAPLLSLLLVDGETLILLITPDNLLVQSAQYTRDAFGPTIPTPVLNFAFERSGSDDMAKQLRSIARKLAFTRENGGVTCTTPNAVKSLFLTYIDRLHIEERVSPLLFLPRALLQKQHGITSTQLNQIDRIGWVMAMRQGEAKLCRDILLALKGAKAIVDEVDMVLHPLKSELNFPIGSKYELQFAQVPREDKTLSREHDDARYRWLLPLHMIDAIWFSVDGPTALDAEMRNYPRAKEVLEDLKKEVEQGVRDCQISRATHFTLLQKRFYDERMRPPLADWALLFVTRGAGAQCVRADLKSRDLPPELLSMSTHVQFWDDVKRLLLYEAQLVALAISIGNAYRMGQGLETCAFDSSHAEFAAIWYKLQGTMTVALLNLCRTYLTSLMPHIISKRSRVDFGLLSDEDAKRLKLVDWEEKTARTGGSDRELTTEELLVIDRASRALLAVPFTGKDAPSKAAEFAIPEVIIGLTVAAYRIEGLRDRDVVKLLKQLLQDFSTQQGVPPDKRPEAERFKRWADAALDRFRELHGEDADEPEFLPLKMLQPADKRHIALVRKLLGTEPQAIQFYLDQIVFEETQRNVVRGGGYASEKLSSSGMDLGSDTLFSCSVGFSGTPSDLLPPAMRPCEPTKGDDAQTINTLTNPNVMHIYEVDIPWTSESILRYVACNGFKALIDAGAIITGFTNQQVAEYILLQPETKWARAAVFIDTQNNKQVVFRGGGPPVPFEQVNIPHGDRFTFFDQGHMVGIDIKQTVDAKAACTLAKGMILRDFAQAVWRMRGIGIGQEVTIIRIPEVRKIVNELRDESKKWNTSSIKLLRGHGEKGAAKHAPTDESKLRDVMNWLIHGSLEAESMTNSTLLVQTAQNVRRRQALEWLRDEHKHAFPLQTEKTPESSSDEALIFTSSFRRGPANAEEVQRVLDEELPVADVRIATMLSELSIKTRLEEDAQFNNLNTRYGHISSPREAARVAARNLVTAKLNGARLGRVGSAETILRIVCGNLLRVQTSELFDPDEGEGSSQSMMKIRERLLALHTQLETIDTQILKEHLDVPLDEAFFGSAFLAPDDNQKRWEEHRRRTEETSQGQTGMSADLSQYPLTTEGDGKHALAETLTEGLYFRLQARAQAEGNSSQLLIQCIQPALQDPSATTTSVVAATAESYMVFEPLFRPLLLKVQPGLTEDGCRQPLLEIQDLRALATYGRFVSGFPSQLERWLDGTTVGWVRLTCTRNLRGLPFLPACTPADLAQVDEIISKAIRELLTHAQMAPALAASSGGAGARRKSVMRTATSSALSFMSSSKKLQPDVATVSASTSPPQDGAVSSARSTTRGQGVNREQQGSVVHGVEIELERLAFTGLLGSVASPDELPCTALFCKPGGGWLCAAGGATNWPQSRTIYCNASPDKQVLIWVNHSDHVRLQTTFANAGSAEKASEAFRCWAVAYAALAREVEKQSPVHSFQPAKELGWLSVDPSRTGSAFDATLQIKLLHAAEGAADHLGGLARETALKVLSKVDGRLGVHAPSGRDADLERLLATYGGGFASATAIAEGFTLKLAHKPKPFTHSSSKSDEKNKEAEMEANAWWELSTARCMGAAESQMFSNLLDGAAALIERDALLAALHDEKRERARQHGKQLRDERKCAELELYAGDRADQSLLPEQKTAGCIRLFREELRQQLLVANTTAKPISQSEAVALIETTFRALTESFPVIPDDNTKRPLLATCVGEIKHAEITQAGASEDDGAGLNTEMVQEQEQQQQQEEEVNNAFGPFDEKIVPEAKYWSPRSLSLSKSEDKEVLQPLQQLQIRSGGNCELFQCEQTTVRFSPNWASPVHHSSMTRRLRNIHMFVRVSLPKSDAADGVNYFIITLAETEALIRHFDGCSGRSPGRPTAGSALLPDAQVEIHSLNGIQILLHKPKAQAPAIKRRVLQRRGSVLAGTAITPPQLVEQLATPKSPASHKALAQYDFDTTRIRLRFWNNEFYFSPDEMLILVAALHALGFDNNSKDELFKSMLKGRRRDKQDITRTPVKEVMQFETADALRELQILLDRKLKATNPLEVQPLLRLTLADRLEELWDEIYGDAEEDDKFSKREDVLRFLGEEVKSPRTVDAIVRGIGVSGSEGLNKQDFLGRVQMWLALDDDEDIESVAERVVAERKNCKTLAPAATAMATASEKDGREQEGHKLITRAAKASNVNEQGNADLSPFVIAVQTPLVGTLSLVVGNALDIFANNLLATRSGGRVTVCPRGVLLKPGSGKWFFEIQVLRASASGGVCMGVVTEHFNVDLKATGVGDDEHGWGMSMQGAQHDGSTRPLGTDQWHDGDVIGCEVDCIGRGELTFLRNGQPIELAGASHTGVRGVIGICPALTIDCGFYGFFNFGKHGFRYPSRRGFTSVHSYIQDERAALHLKMTPPNAVGRMSAICNTRSVSISRVADEDEEVVWRMQRPVRYYWAYTTITPSGVLLTKGRWYFEVVVHGGCGNIAVGCCDSEFGTKESLGRFGKLGDEKHSWSMEFGTWLQRTGLLFHKKKKQVFGGETCAPAFGSLATFKDLVVGCAIDADKGSMHFACRDESGKPVCALAFEGMQFEGGLIPAVGSVHAEFDVRLGHSELLDALQRSSEGTVGVLLPGYLPLQARLDQMAHEYGGQTMAGHAGPSWMHSRHWLVPSSGHDHLFHSEETIRMAAFDYRQLSGTITCNYFLCSVTAPELLCRRGSFYYEVYLLSLGTSTSFDFDDDAEEYNEASNAAPDLDVQSDGDGCGLGAIGWGSRSRFRGEYHVFQGVGDEANSWGFAGAKPKPDTQTKCAEFKSTTPRPQAQAWPMEEDGKPKPEWCVRGETFTRPVGKHADETWPLWKVGGVVGTAVVVNDDGSGCIDFFYNGAKCFSQEVNAPLLKSGVVPAISLHSKFKVHVNMGEQDFCHGRDPETGQLIYGREPPASSGGSYHAAIRSHTGAIEEGGSTISVAAKRRADRAKMLRSQLLQQASQEDIVRKVRAVLFEDIDVGEHDQVPQLEFRSAPEVIEELLEIASLARKNATRLSRISEIDPRLSLAARPSIAKETRVSLGAADAQLEPAAADAAGLGGAASPPRKTTVPGDTRKTRRMSKAHALAALAEAQAATAHLPELILDLTKLKKANERISLADEALVLKIFDALQCLPNGGVQRIRARSCGLQSHTIRALAKRLEVQEALRSLDLSGNTLDAEAMTALALALRTMNDANLTELDVSANEFIKDDGIAALCCNLSPPTEPEKGKGIRVLNLAQTSISIDGTSAIAQALKRLPLRELVLDNNKIGRAGAEVLACALKVGTSAGTLEKLSLSSNGLTDAGVTELANGLSHNSTLTRLNLGSNNQISGAGLRDLAASLRSNKRSSLCQLRLVEPSVQESAAVELLFSLKAAVLATARVADHEPELYFAGLVHGVHARPQSDSSFSGHVSSHHGGERSATSKKREKTGNEQQHPSQRAGGREATHLNVLRGSEARRFFDGPLTFCVQSLPTSARLSDLAKYLVRDRLKRADDSYVKPPDAHAALIESILLNKEDDRKLIIELMIGADSRVGVHQFKLRDQQTCTVMLTTSLELERGETLTACCMREGELWMHRVQRRGGAASMAKRSSTAHSVSMSMSTSVSAPHGKLPERSCAPSGSPGREELHVFLPEQADVVQRDVELKQDLWLAAHPVGDEASRLLLDGARQLVRNGRTALLLAIHAGHQDAALQLVQRLPALRCRIFDSVTRQQVHDCPVLVVLDINQLTKDKLADHGAEGRSGDLVVLQNPDAVDIGAAERAADGQLTGVEALRAAAIRGMAPVVTALLELRQRQGSTPILTEHKVLRRVPCHRVAGLMGMHADRVDAHRRTLLHDVCRNLLPRDDGITHATLNGELVEFASQIIGLQDARGREIGKKLAYRLDKRQREGRILPGRDSYKRLALHYAAAFGHVEIVELLLEIISEAQETQQLINYASLSRGTKPVSLFDVINARDVQGWTPLALATSNGHCTTVKMLTQHGADPMVPMLKPLNASEEADERLDAPLSESKAPGAFDDRLLQDAGIEAVPCAFTLSLLRLHFEESVRPELREKRLEDDLQRNDGGTDPIGNAMSGIATNASERYNDAAVALHEVFVLPVPTPKPAPEWAATRVTQFKDGGVAAIEMASTASEDADTSSVPPHGLNPVGQATDPSARQKSGSKVRLSPSPRIAPSGTAPAVHLVGADAGEDPESLSAQLLGESNSQPQEWRDLANAIHKELIDAPGWSPPSGAPEQSVARYRSFFLVERVVNSVLLNLLYIVLLLVVVLHTGGGGGAGLGRSSPWGVSYPYVLQSQVGQLVSAEVFNHEEEMDFNGIDQWSVLQEFLDPSDGETSPLFAILFDSDEGHIDNDNDLLGAVRLRVQRLEANDELCPESWLSTAQHVCPTAGGRLATSSFTGPISGQLYPYCSNGIFCQPSNATSDSFQSLLWGFGPESRGQYGLEGYVLDLPPRNPDRAKAIVSGLLDDNLLNDGAARALFIDFTIYNHMLSYAIVVHLSVELLLSGRMRAFTDSIALPLDWPFDNLLLVGLEWLLMIWTVLKVLRELSTIVESYQEGATYFDKWNVLDLTGLCIIMLWVSTRVWWWIALLHWHGLDPFTDAYVGWMQPLARLTFLARTFASFAVIFGSMCLFKDLKLLPGMGPLLQALLSTMFSTNVFIFIIVVLLFVLIFTLGCHIGFGMDLLEFSTFDVAYVSTFASFFGDWGKDSLSDLTGSVGDRSPGMLMWLLVAVLGLAMLTNVFIAVIGEEYNKFIGIMIDDWEAATNQLMRWQVWHDVQDQLQASGPLHDLCAELPTNSKLRPKRRWWQHRWLYGCCLKLYRRSHLDWAWAWLFLRNRLARTGLVHVGGAYGDPEAAGYARKLEYFHRHGASDGRRAQGSGIDEPWYAQRSFWHKTFWHETGEGGEVSRPALRTSHRAEELAAFVRALDAFFVEQAGEGEEAPRRPRDPRLDVLVFPNLAHASWHKSPMRRRALPPTQHVAYPARTFRTLLLRAVTAAVNSCAHVHTPWRLMAPEEQEAAMDAVRKHFFGDLALSYGREDPAAFERFVADVADVADSGFHLFVVGMCVRRGMELPKSAAEAASAAAANAEGAAASASRKPSAEASSYELTRERRYPPCDSKWYEEEVRLRFCFSWCAVPRFELEACKYELETDEARTSRTKATNFESLRRKQAETVSLVEELRAQIASRERA